MDGFSNDLHANDLIQDKIPARGGAAYRDLRACIAACIEEARGVKEGRDILEGYAAVMDEVLILHEATTAQLMKNDRDSSGDDSSKDMSELLAHSNEYLTFTGHLVVGWMWLKQGIIANRMLSSNAEALSDSDRNFYLGKIAALDYFCNIELQKVKSMADILRINPQVGNLHDISWHN